MAQLPAASPRQGALSFLGVVVLPSAASKYKAQARLRVPACAAALLRPPPPGCGRLRAGCCFYERRHCARSCDHRHRDSHHRGGVVALPLQVRSWACLDPGRGVAATCRGPGWHWVLSRLAEDSQGLVWGWGCWDWGSTPGAWRVQPQGWPRNASPQPPRPKSAPWGLWFRSLRRHLADASGAPGVWGS